MKYKEAIEHSKNKKGMKQSVSGLFESSAVFLDSIGENEHGCDSGAGYAFTLRIMAEHFYKAREAWLNDDLEKVAEFFGLYV